MSLVALTLALGVGALALPNEVGAQETTNAAAPTPPTAAKPGVELLRHKLESIIIDKVNFNKTDIDDVVQFLQMKSKELDPDKAGVNFVLRLVSLPTDDQTIAIHRDVSLTVENVPLGRDIGRHHSTDQPSAYGQ